MPSSILTLSNSAGTADREVVVRALTSLARQSSGLAIDVQVSRSLLQVRLKIKLRQNKFL